MAGPCASLAWGATSVVMRRVASRLMSCSSSSDMPCPGSQPSEHWLAACFAPSVDSLCPCVCH